MKRMWAVGSVVCDKGMKLSHLITSLAHGQSSHGLFWALTWWWPLQSARGMFPRWIWALMPLPTWSKLTAETLALFQALRRQQVVVCGIPSSNLVVTNSLFFSHPGHACQQQALWSLGMEEGSPKACLCSLVFVTRAQKVQSWACPESLELDQLGEYGWIRPLHYCCIFRTVLQFTTFTPSHFCSFLFANRFAF